MDLTQRDRDALRQAQHNLNPSSAFHIGHIVEHKIQNPMTYKSKSRQEQGIGEDDRPSLPKIEYKSVHFSEEGNDSVLPCDTLTRLPEGEGTKTSSEKRDKHLDLPIKPDDVQSNLWLNMDRVEFEKLEWMSQKAERGYLEKLQTTVHFDSDGKAISPSSINAEAPNQQVHDVGSLVRLLDSTFLPQVTYALNIIAKISKRATLGLYDAVFDENIHQVLIKECLLRVRHHIDSSNETICQGALNCLRSLLCNTQIDEVFLDKMSPMQIGEPNATLWLSCKQEDFGIDMKDNDCIQSDAILGLIARTDILARFKYLLNNKIDPRFSRTYQDCILDMLIRVARYSPQVCWILHNNDFTQLMVDNFLPVDIIYKDHPQQSISLRAIKFLRIIAQASVELSRSKESESGGPVIRLPSSIIQIVNTYYHLSSEQQLETLSDVMLRMQIETLRLMKSLSLMKDFSSHILSTLALNQNSLVERVRGLTRLSVLKSIEACNSLDWQYAAALLDLLGSMMDHERHNSHNIFIYPLWVDFIRHKTLQWFSDLMNDRCIPHQDISIALHVAVNIFLQSRDDTALHDLYSVVLINSNKTIDTRTNTKLIYFKYLVREATNGSSLNNFQEINGCRRDPVMLPSYGSMNYNTSTQCSCQLNGVIAKDTPYILLNLYLTILKRSYKGSNELMRFYVDSVDLIRHLQIATCYYTFPLSYESEVQRSLLAQLEISVLANANLLLSRYYLKSKIADTESKEVFREPLDLKRTRSESYSQFVFKVYSLIGLMNPEIGHMLDLKDSLLELVIFDACMHFRLSLESYITSDNTTIKDLKFNEFNRRLYDGRTFKEEFSLSGDDLLVMKSIYLSCEQPGRYWLFEPVIEYYCSQVREGSERVTDGRWFLQNINMNKQNKFLPADCDDVSVICRVLKLNLILMHQSSSYLHIIIRHNVEEYLCLIGSIFLDDNLFLDSRVNKIMWYNLEMILSFGVESSIANLFSDASQKIRTLDLPLNDFFNKLVDQYEAASYNDPVFTNFILLFLSPRSDKSFRRKLFSDKLETCLMQMRISTEDVWIPEELLLEPREQDSEIKCLIKRSGAYIKKSIFLSKYIRHHTT